MIAPRSVLVALAVVAAGCPSGGGGGGEQEHKPNLLRGDRETSPSLRSSAARPRPGAEWEANPLDGDRLGLDEAMDRARRAHNEAHAEASLALEDFSHPACSALPRADRRACPLSSVHWSGLRSVEGGVEIETREPTVEPTRLRWLFLCHIAFERSHGGKGCPLGAPGLDLSVLKVGGRTTVRLVAQDAAALRRQVRLLVNPR